MKAYLEAARVTGQARRLGPDRCWPSSKSGQRHRLRHRQHVLAPVMNFVRAMQSRQRPGHRALPAIAGAVARRLQSASSCSSTSTSPRPDDPHHRLHPRHHANSPAPACRNSSAAPFLANLLSLAGVNELGERIPPPPIHPERQESTTSKLMQLGRQPRRAAARNRHGTLFARVEQATRPLPARACGATATCWVPYLDRFRRTAQAAIPYYDKPRRFAYPYGLR